MMQAVYLRPLGENYTGLASYYGDVVLWEPALIRMYDDVVPQIDRALGQWTATAVVLNGRPAGRRAS
jgi:hypothetical protein